jgi:hypothetical protein
MTQQSNQLPVPYFYDPYEFARLPNSRERMGGILIVATEDGDEPNLLPPFYKIAGLLDGLIHAESFSHIIKRASYPVYVPQQILTGLEPVSYNYLHTQSGHPEQIVLTFGSGDAQSGYKVLRLTSTDAYAKITYPNSMRYFVENKLQLASFFTEFDDAAVTPALGSDPELIELSISLYNVNLKGEILHWGFRYELCFFRLWNSETVLTGIAYNVSEPEIREIFRNLTAINANAELLRYYQHVL